ncbi:MAG: TetR/AcrR family transcriptional regulator [Anaerolineales bacterium]
MSVSEQKKKIIPKSGKETEDRRTVRTQRMIKQALMELMHSMRYEDITVQEIIDRADVGRSTFYAHYPDKDDLVKQLFEEMLESITRGVKAVEGENRVSFPIAGMFRHLQDQNVSAHAVWQSNRGREYLFYIGQAYWNRRIERELKAHQPKGGTPGVPLPVVAQMLTGAATSLLNWWIKNKMPYSPEEMQEMFDRMMQPGIRSL